jgi:isoquinoline 1-oxidoreductase beta subunit
VTVHVTLLGCGWGRRSRTDFVQDAVETSKAVGAPVQLLWTREEDMQHDFYRPAVHHRLSGAVDAGGRLTALHAKVVAQPFASRSGVDGPAVAGLAEVDYAIPNLLVEYCRPDLPVPVGYWRSVGPSQNTFILEASWMSSRLANGIPSSSAASAVTRPSCGTCWTRGPARRMGAGSPGRPAGWR